MKLETRYKTLEQFQMDYLNSLLAVHGNGAALTKRTGLNINTIKRAALGLTISEETAKILCKHLNRLMNNDSAVATHEENALANTFGKI